MPLFSLYSAVSLIFFLFVYIITNKSFQLHNLTENKLNSTNLLIFKKQNVSRKKLNDFYSKFYTT